MSSTFRSRLALPVFLVLLLVALPTTALAHERRTIGAGKYDVVVGWAVEPAYQNQKNAATIRINLAGTDGSPPVEGADKSLKVQVRQGAQTREFPLHAVFGQAGYYGVDIVPTRAGDYVWTFAGSINADPVNETFDTADGKFDEVVAPASIEFPIALPDPVQAAAAAQTAQSDAQTSRMLAYAGIALGILGLIVGAAGWASRLRGQGVAPVQTSLEERLSAPSGASRAPKGKVQ